MAESYRIRTERRPGQGLAPPYLLATLTERRRRSRVPTGSWRLFVPEAERGLEHVRAEAGRLGLGLVGDGVCIPFATVGRMPPAMAGFLGLPPIFDGEISLRLSSSLAAPDLVVSPDFQRGSAFGDWSRLGAFLQSGERTALLLPRVAALCDTLAKLAAQPPSPERRDAFVHHVLSALGEDAYPFLRDKSLRIRQAGRVNLLRMPAADGKATVVPSLADATGKPLLVDWAEEPFLAYLDDACNADLPPVFAHGSTVVVPSEHVLGTLEWAAQEREFPSAALPAPPLPDEVGFAAHVEGFAAWDAPRLPFLRRRGAPRIPEVFYAQVGERMAALAPEVAAGLADAVEEAKAVRAETVRVGDEAFPVDMAEFLAHVVEEQVAPFRERIAGAAVGLDGPVPSGSGTASDAAHVGGTGPEAAHRTAAGMALRCRDNYLQVGYVAPRTPRDAGLLAERPADVVSASLRPGVRLALHQAEAVDWLAGHYVGGSPGVLLCDEPGLGKTFSGLAMAAWIAAKAKPGHPILVVVPHDLRDNWQAEARKWFRGRPLGTPYVAIGRPFSGSGPRPSDITALLRHTWVVTTYQTFTRYHGFFNQVPWAAAFLDEAQLAKNPATLLRNAVFSIRADIRVGLTGTPVENAPEDVWSLYDGVSPGALGSLKDFVGEAYDGEELREGHARALSDLLLRPSEGLPPMLRRHKDSLLTGLPAKVRHLLPARMPPVQEAAYRSILEAAPSMRGRRGWGLGLLWRLNVASLHPRASRAFTHAPSRAEALAWIAESARLQQALAALVPAMEAGEKALVVLNDRALQPIVARAFHAALGLAADPLWINGDLDQTRRRERSDRFREAPGPGLLFMTYKVGGLGHTFVEARHVFQLSRWPNPAVERQAEDRTHRMGQEGEVQVYVPQAIYAPQEERSVDLALERIYQAKSALARELLIPSRLDRDIEAMVEAFALAA